MLFNSYAFIFAFLPIVAIAFFVIGRWSRHAAAWLLVVASLTFYGMWDSHYVPLLLASILFNFGSGLAIMRFGPKGHGRLILSLAIAGNLALLAYYKYWNFFASSVLPLTGFEPVISTIILPLGISFFTFTQIAFLVDVYRGHVREYRFAHYVLFVTYFPHLIAGPVLHHKQMMPQFDTAITYRPNRDNILAGVALFILGLTKKVVLADSLAMHASTVFGDAAIGIPVGMLEAWIGALAYTLQLYFDFSGYCDMAAGASLMFNIRLPQNFNSPYKSLSIIDFWRRWHITLSEFLRDYLYIPLGGSKHGMPRRYTNLFLTMLLGGLWHGAGWTFIVWGALHGFYLIVNHGFRAARSALGFTRGIPGGHLLAGLVTFACVVAGWVVFRAPNLETAWLMLRGMAGANGVSLPSMIYGVIAPALRALGLADVSIVNTYVNYPVALVDIVIGLGLVWLFPNTNAIMQKFHPVLTPSPRESQVRPVSVAQSRLLLWRMTPIQGALIGVAFFFALVIMNTRTSEFLYFQF